MYSKLFYRINLQLLLLVSLRSEQGEENAFFFIWHFLAIAFVHFSVRPFKLTDFFLSIDKQDEKTFYMQEIAVIFFSVY